jgi:hypothetical protein
MNDFPDIPQEFYGKWLDYVQEMRRKRDSTTLEVRGTVVPDPVPSQPTSSDDNPTLPVLPPITTPTPVQHSLKTQNLNESLPKQSTNNYPGDEYVNKKLSRLRGLGLNISTTSSPTPELAGIMSGIIPSIKPKNACESNRGKGRRKTSLN